MSDKMHLAATYEEEFEKWRTARGTPYSQEDGLIRLRANVPIDPATSYGFQSPLCLLLNLTCPLLARRTTDPDEISKLATIYTPAEMAEATNPTPLQWESSELATLGLATVHKWREVLAVDPDSDASGLLQARLLELRAVCELSHRYWALHDKQEQVRQASRAEGKREQKSATSAKGGKKRASLYAAAKDMAFKLAQEGLDTESKPLRRYGKWAKQETMIKEIHAAVLKDAALPRSKNGTDLDERTVGRWIGDIFGDRLKAMRQSSLTR